MSRLHVNYTLSYYDSLRFNLFHLSRSPYMWTLALAYFG
jgi:hypothetical protein